MCQITINNLHDEMLNKRMYLLLGTLGSVVHNDGWGFSGGLQGKIFKCAHAMNWTSDAGQVLRDAKVAKTSPFIGHIRQASPLVPVTKENAHPFVLENITFVHNGKLVPKKEEDFILEFEVQSKDKDGKPEVEKDGKPRMTKVKRSDSLVFFEEFIKDWKSVEEADQHKKFVEVLQKTMDKFYGKFAMVFNIGGSVYIVRGKTAELNISYLLKAPYEEKDAIGWTINTDKKTVDISCLLLSNLEQLDGKPFLYFTQPELLEPETIYLAKDTGLVKIGEVKENSIPINTTWQGRNWRGANDDANFSTRTGNLDSTKTAVKYAKEIYEFMNDYSLYPVDINNIFLAVYGTSLSEVTEENVEHFCKRVIPTLKNKTTKKIRKNLKSSLGLVSLGFHFYKDNLQYPWMLNSLETQQKLIKAVGNYQKNIR